MLSCLLLCALTATAAPPAHDNAYWMNIVRTGFAVPEGESAFALARELDDLLGSPDPEMRDRVAYRILSVWLGGEAKFTAEELGTLQQEWQSNLRADSVLKRSFSALSLASLVERDRKEPFLDARRYHDLLGAALDSLAAERDLRGYDEKLGWVHATAHTADLLAELARHAQLTAEDQGRILNDIAIRIASAPEVFTQGEQDRLAQAVAAIVMRQDFDAARFESWLSGVVMTRRKAARTSPLTLVALATYQNSNYFLQALYARLSMEKLDAAGLKAQTRVLEVLR